MYSKIKIISIASVLLSAFTTITVQAQNNQSLSQNVGNRIQQYAASGYIDQKQASKLQNQLAQIMQREVQGMNQNGGNLNPLARQQIMNDSNNLENTLNNEARRNNPNFVPPRELGQWQNHPGYYDQGHRWHGYAYDQHSHNWNNNVNNNWNNNANNNNIPPPNPNNDYHHHRHWNNQQ